MGVVKLAQASLNFWITLGAGPWLSDCFREVKVFQTKENGLNAFFINILPSANQNGAVFYQ